MRKLSSLIRRLGLGSAWVLATAYIAACLAISLVLANNTLINNGNWVSGKEQLGIKVMGAPAFVRRTQALAQGHLNLDAWHGYQEVITREKMKMNSAEFDFILADGAYFSFELKEADRFSGFRISKNPALENIYFVSKASGEFIEQHPLELPEFPPDRWNHFKLFTGPAGPAIEINGAYAKCGSLALPDFCQPGFRGCERHAAIDNVRLGQGGCIVLEDSFLNTSDLRRYFTLAVIVLLLLSAVLYGSLVMLRIPEGKSFSVVVLFNGIMSLLVTAMPPFLYVALAWYPSQGSLDRAESAYLFNMWLWRNEEILADAHKEEDGKRILFVGSSQTFGAGALSEKETFVNRVQQRLDEWTKNGRRYQCINAGINGAGTPTLLPSYQQYWLQLAPSVTIINLGCNDRLNSDQVYAENLEGFIKTNEEHHIQTVFVLEATSWEWRNEGNEDGSVGLHTHEVMKKVAAAHGIPVIDMNARLKENITRGFLWWDFVHPTSFGHQLIADCIFTELQKVLSAEPRGE